MEKPPVPKAQVTKKDLATARSIFFKAKLKHKLHPEVRRYKSWASHLAAIRLLDGQEEQEVDKVLEWFVTTIGSDYGVQAFSGETIRERYQDIKRAYEQSSQPYAVSLVSEDSERLAASSLSLGWPAIIDPKVLPAAFQKTLDFYRHVRDGLEALRASPRPYKNISAQRVANWAGFLADKLARPVNMTELWWEFGVRQKLVRRPRWDGNVKEWTLCARHPEVKVLFFNEWCGGWTTGDDLRTLWELFQEIAK